MKHIHRLIDWVKFWHLTVISCAFFAAAMVFLWRGEYLRCLIADGVVWIIARFIIDGSTTKPTKG